MIWFPWLRDKDRLKCEGISVNTDIAFYEYHDSLFTAKGPEHGSLCTESLNQGRPQLTQECVKCGMKANCNFSTAEECEWVDEKFCEYFAAPQLTGIDSK